MIFISERDNGEKSFDELQNVHLKLEIRIKEMYILQYWKFQTDYDK